MNKKEEIRLLKNRVVTLTSKLGLAEEVLEPYKKSATQRGARMQIMYQHICDIAEYDYELPEHFKEWFDMYGAPL